MKRWTCVLIATMTAIVGACGQENSSATPSDDTQSASQVKTTEKILSSGNASIPPASPTTNATVEIPSVAISTTIPMNNAVEISTTSSVINQSSTTVKTATGNNGSVPVASTSPKKTRPVATLAPECDVMPLADCRNVDLRGRDLFYANFQGANLAGANMSGMDLTGADFTGANLTGANLIGTTLDYAYFFDANLTEAKLTRASMSGIIWDDTTIWPVGYVPPDY